MHKECQTFVNIARFLHLFLVLLTLLRLCMQVAKYLSIFISIVLDSINLNQARYFKLMHIQNPWLYSCVNVARVIEVNINGNYYINIWKLLTAFISRQGLVTWYRIKIKFSLTLYMLTWWIYYYIPIILNASKCYFEGLETLIFSPILFSKSSPLPLLLIC